MHASEAETPSASAAIVVAAIFNVVTRTTGRPAHGESSFSYSIGAIPAGTSRENPTILLLGLNVFNSGRTFQLI
jgi:hypothetical protein